VRILCNLPLDCFDDRRRFAGIELCTYGPRGRMRVDGDLWPFDVEFDPSTGTLEQLLAALPRAFRPDLLLLYWPDQEPLPQGLERCPVPVVGVMSDYNLTLPYVAGLWPFFDAWLCDRPGVDLFRRLSFAGVRPWCQFSFKAPYHRLDPRVPRVVDVGFCGNVHPDVQRERMPWVERLIALGRRGVKLEVRSGVHGAEYGRFLNRLRIGWNRSIRGEMNLRAFEVPACGALLLMEEENQELREYLTPGVECAVYGPRNFEQVVQDLLADPATLQRMAAAGHERVVASHRYRDRLRELVGLLADLRVARPPATPAELALGRATALFSCVWGSVDTVVAAATEAARLAPADPRPWNLLALALLRKDVRGQAARAFELLARAHALAPGHLPAAANLVHLLQAGGQPERAAALRGELERRLRDQPVAWLDLDGPTLPVGFSAHAIGVSHALARAVRDGDPGRWADAWLPVPPPQPAALAPR
jgi:hypothetical protein